MQSLPKGDYYLAHDVFAEGIRPSKAGLKAVAEFPNQLIIPKLEHFWVW